MASSPATELLFFGVYVNLCVAQVIHECHEVIRQVCRYYTSLTLCRHTTIPVFRAITELIRVQPSFTNLSIRGTGVSAPVRTEDAEKRVVFTELLRVIANHPRLTHVEFAHVNIPSESIVTAATGWETNTVLTELVLGYANLDGTAGSALGRMLGRNRSLRTLDLTGNNFTMAAVEDLATGVAHNTTIEELRIRARFACLSVHTHTRVMDDTQSSIRTAVRTMFAETLRVNCSLQICAPCFGDVTVFMYNDALGRELLARYRIPHVRFLIRTRELMRNSRAQLALDGNALCPIAWVCNRAPMWVAIQVVQLLCDTRSMY